MNKSIIIGQGIAGSTLAWELHWAGHEVHLVERKEGQSASRVAAGLITPITGKRLTKAADFDEANRVAEEFYGKVEATIGTTLQEKRAALRYFESDSERDTFLEERAELIGEEIELLRNDRQQVIGIRMLKAARLRVQDYLEGTQRYFQERGQYHEANVDAGSDIEVRADGVSIRHIKLDGTRLFFCQGYQSQQNPWFPGIPDAPVRGETLTVTIPSRETKDVVHQGYWLAPIAAKVADRNNRTYVIGATYDRDNLGETITASGREELLAALKRFTEEEVVVIGQASAVRATTRGGQAIAMMHPEYSQLGIMNGLGSKGSLMAPLIAKKLVESLSQKAANVREPSKPKALTKLAHTIVGRTLRAGDTALDGTAGNGNDTIFLAKSVGSQGRVLAVDNQSEAIESTKTRLHAEGIENVELYEEDHSVVLRRQVQANESVQAIMLNLGYRPGGDKLWTTKPETTTAALEAGIELLSKGGVMTVVAYRGHPGGKTEAEAVQQQAQKHAAAGIKVDIIPGSEDNEESPVLYVFRK